MVDFKKLTDRAKDLVDKRGGTEGLKKDASELMDIAKSKGSVGDKAKTAMDRLKRPAHEREGEGDTSAPGGETPAATTGGGAPSGETPAEPSAKPVAEEPEKREPGTRPEAP